MTESTGREFSRAETAIEGGVIAILTGLTSLLQTDWRFYWIFNLTIILIIALYILRVAATQAEEPRWKAIRATTKVSSRLVELAALGVLGSAAIRFTESVGWVTSPIWTFAGLTFAVTIGIALVDQLLLGEYAGFWAERIREEHSGGIGEGVILRAADVGEAHIENNMSTDADHEKQSMSEAVGLGLALVGVFVAVAFPVWYLIAGVYGSHIAAIVSVLAVIFLRDVSRYLYLNYGPAEDFSEIKGTLSGGVLILFFELFLFGDLLGYTVNI